MPKRRSHRPGHGRVTLTDVAREAGVSAITVSRAIRTPDLLSPATRAVVLEAIDRVGYIRNLAAGALASQRSRTVAAIVPTLGNSIFALTLQGLMEHLDQAGYQLLIGTNDYDLDLEAQLVRAFVSRQVDGIVLTGRNRSEETRKLLASMKLPVVELWSAGRQEGVVTVGFSNFDASFAMVAHLAQSGYREIGFVSAPLDDNDRAQARREGYEAALRAHGLPLDPRRIRTSHFSLEAGAKVLVEILDTVPSTDAIFFANDTLAAGAVMEANRRGIAVPGRVAIAGFDDLEIARWLTPALTTVRVPRREIGWTAATVLLETLEEDRHDPEDVDLGFEVIVRATA